MRTRPFDAVKYFPDDAAQIDLVADALASGEAGYIAAALRTIADARGMTRPPTLAGIVTDQGGAVVQRAP